MPTEFIERELTAFILLPIRHICLLDDIFQSVLIEQPSAMNSNDSKIVEGKLSTTFSKQHARRLLYRRSISRSTSTRSSAIILSPSAGHNDHDLGIISLRSTECNFGIIAKHHNAIRPITDDRLATHEQRSLGTGTLLRILWRWSVIDALPFLQKRLELSAAKLWFTGMDGIETSNEHLTLASVVHIQEDPAHEELRLIVAGPSTKSSKHSSVKMMRVYLRFQRQEEYWTWFHHLTDAIQQAKDHSWTKTNELVIWEPRPITSLCTCAFAVKIFLN